MDNLERNRCVNFQDVFGDTYIISYAQVTEIIPALKSDPWNFLLHCKFGTISTHGGKLIEAWIPENHPRKKNRIIRECDEWIETAFDTDEGIGIVLHVDGFETLAEIIKPHKKPTLSEEVREKKRLQMLKNREGLGKPCK